MSNEKRDTSGDRYVAVALMEAGGHASTGVLDREANEIAQFLRWDEADWLNNGEMARDNMYWTSADRVVILGELGPVPERIKPPFEPVEFTDVDGDMVDVRRGESQGRQAAYLTMDAGPSVYITAEQAPAVASAILRAAGLDVESVVLPKGGE